MSPIPLVRQAESVASGRSRRHDS